MCNRTIAPLALLSVGFAMVAPAAPPRDAIRLADLLALPDKALRADTVFRADPYLRVASGLQAMGKKKACSLLLQLARKERLFFTRTHVLCRMLFQAKPGSTFRPPNVGLPGVPGGTGNDDWPSLPIEVVDGVPFLVVSGYTLAGFPEKPEDYVKYCMKECDWNTFKFTPRTMAEKQKALEKFLASPKLKGKLDKAEREVFETQIK